MENINNLPPQLAPSQPQSVQAKPIANAADETKKLVEMTPPAPVQMPDLGTKVDLKV